MAEEGDGWRVLVARGRRGVVTVLAGGVLLFAVDTYVTASLLPSAVADIGGARFYAWVTTVYLLTSVLSATLVSRVLAALGPRRAYLWALAAFGVGVLGAALAPAMGVLLVTRAVQGLGGGLLAGAAYVLARRVLPPSMWTRASALISTMWGLGLLLGPALGGMLAEVGAWRAAFAVLAGATAGLALLVPGVLPRRLGGDDDTVDRSGPLPVMSVVTVAAAAAVVSVTGLAGSPALAAGGVVVAAALLVVLLRHERTTAAGVLPAAVFRRGSSLRWVLAANAVFSAAATVEGYVPLFGQRLGELSPLLAGFLGAALSAGWVGGEVTSASVRRVRPARLVLAGSVAVVVGLVVVALTQADDATPGTVLVWTAGLAVTGVGIGTAWPHLAAGAMRAGGEADDGDRASASITIVQMLATTLGAALTGVAVTLGEPDPVRSAHLLFGGFAALALLGVAAAGALLRTERPVRAVGPGGRAGR